MHKPALLAAMPLLLAGCASFSPDGGFERVAELTQDRVGHLPSYQRSLADVQAAQARIGELLAQPLDAERAVELALLNNRGLQARFGELGIAEAALVRAGRLRNPSFAFGRMREGGGVVEIERSFMFDVLGLLTLPLATRIEQRRFAQAQLRAAQEAVALAGEVRRAQVEAVAARQLVGYFEQVKEAADASSELARRMAQAGNFSTLQRLREQAFQADASARLVQARQRALAARERLARLLGLQGAQLDFVLPERLPELPPQPLASADAQQAAMDRRLDVALARRAVESTATSLGLTRATRFVDVLELGYANRSESREPRADGWEVELVLPLFDFGSTGTAQAETVYMQAVHHAAAVAVDARSELREADAAYRSAHALATHYRDEVVPLRERISQENLLRYNGMLIGVFELLADAREQIAGVTGAIEARRDFWLADADLRTALAGASPDAAR